MIETVFRNNDFRDSFDGGGHRSLDANSRVDSPLWEMREAVR
jgi:hypothetical protein